MHGPRTRQHGSMQRAASGGGTTGGRGGDGAAKNINEGTGPFPTPFRTEAFLSDLSQESAIKILTESLKKACGDEEWGGRSVRSIGVSEYGRETRGEGGEQAGLR